MSAAELAAVCSTKLQREPRTLTRRGEGWFMVGMAGLLAAVVAFVVWIVVAFPPPAAAPSTTPTTLYRTKEARDFLVPYRGFDLHCVPTGGWAASACDFQRFYAEHPELLAVR